MNAPPPLRFGIDLGGTKIEGAILDAAGEIVFRHRIPTEREGGYEHILARIASLYAGMRSLAAGAPHTLGVGTPGSLSPTTSLLRNSNTECLNGRPLAADLAASLAHPLALENDANCFALAEARLGAGRGHAIVFGVIMGTGCGGGLVIDGRIHGGGNRLAGEWGHTVLDPAGPACYCGAKGCVETFISGSGLENRYFERTGRRGSAAAIFAAADSGDESARASVDAFVDAFGRAVANLVAILDPDVIVLGGGLSNAALLYDRGRAAIERHVFGREFRTPLLPHELGDSAGVLGAALLGI